MMVKDESLNAFIRDLRALHRKGYTCRIVGTDECDNGDIVFRVAMIKQDDSHTPPNLEKELKSE